MKLIPQPKTHHKLSVCSSINLNKRCKQTLPLYLIVRPQSPINKKGIKYRLLFYISFLK